MNIGISINYEPFDANGETCQRCGVLITGQGWMMFLVLTGEVLPMESRLVLCEDCKDDEENDECILFIRKLGEDEWHKMVTSKSWVGDIFRQEWEYSHADLTEEGVLFTFYNFNIPSMTQLPLDGDVSILIAGEWYKFSKDPA